MAREADRFLYLADFAVAILAAYGLDVLLTHSPAARWAEFNRCFRWTALAAGVALVWPHILGKGDLSPWIALSLLFILLAFGLFRYVDVHGDGRWPRFLILALILFDLSAFDWSAANRIEAASKNEDYLSVLRRARGVSDFLRAKPGPFRVDVSGDLPPNIGDAFGVETMRGAAVTMDTGFDQIRGHTDPLNVKYTVRPASAKDGGAIYLDADWKVYENPAAFPRAWLVHQTVVEPDSAKALARLNDPAIDLHRVAIIEAPLRRPLPAELDACAAGGEVTVSRPRNDELMARVQSRGAGVLVLSELYYPGWRATLNGASVPILKVDGGLRGIRVPGGSSVVHLHYVPVSVYGGLLLSLLTFAAAAASAYMGLR
jgi:hypothetical protein